MNFRKVNNITGWLVFAIAYVTYLLTMEATASLWDCGEFLSTAYRLEVGHSPGAPLFMMLGRLFAILAPAPDKVAIFINSMSALMSGLTILFLFWTITHFARKLVVKRDEDMSTANLIAIMGAGIVGALAYTFSDTFWFSAVEGEVYATSSFFTAIVFWAVLKWEHQADNPHADRWLILIFYLMGLSIGVHLLNLLTIPAIVMVYYFKRYNVTLGGAIVAFFVGCLILGVVQFGIIQYLPIFASQFELLFVNTLHMPFNSGALFFILLLAVMFAIGLIKDKKPWHPIALRVLFIFVVLIGTGSSIVAKVILIALILVQYFFLKTKDKSRQVIQLAVLSMLFTIIGYSSYVTIIIRSNADVPIDMGNPDNIMTLIPYLQRDQYGSQPLIMGPDFTSRMTAANDGREIYAAVKKDGKETYELVDHKPEYEYDKVRFFPRIHDFNDPNHINYYRSYLDLGEGEEPTAMDNQKFFWGYQMNWMYWRYVMWNFAGRQNDLEGQGEAHNGNWISGIKPVDKFFGRGDLDKMPESFRNSKANNKLYFLPLILGFIGLVYQFNRDRRDGVIVGLLFFFTGIAIVLYLNNTPLQPRERDYAYAGSTYAFAIWIGLGVLMVADWFRKVMKDSAPAIAATLICLLAVPVLMAAEEWDDHDRSKKTIARDHAYNMLMSCDSNAILITYGDNDTYPLWYLQEIEGVRPDIRIINYNLLGTDWQNEQLTFKVNDADALPGIWTPDQYRGGKLNYIRYMDNPRIPKDRFFGLEEIINFFTSDKNQIRVGDNEMTGYLPTRNFELKVDRTALMKSGLVAAADSAAIPDVIRWQFNRDLATRGDMALMNILAGQAKTGWTRPLYMTDGTPNLGLDAYFFSEGPLRKFVPINKVSPVNGLSAFTDLDKNIKLQTKVFNMGGASGKNIYYDEKNRMLFLIYRQNAVELSIALSAVNRKPEAVKVLDHYMSMVSETSLPFDVLGYDRSIMLMVDAYYRAGAPEKARKIGEKMLKNISDEVNYYNSLGEIYKAIDLGAVQQNLSVLNYLSNFALQNGDNASGQKWQQALMRLQQGIPAPQQRQQP